MPRIMISYRRADSDAIAGRIRDRLATQFGDDCVFMDIDSIPVGIDFRDQIKNELLKNDILLVVIGTKWRGPSKGGRARIYDENDPVRVEVETALQRSIPVVPVLVGGATMPKPDELPESLNKFSFHNAAVVDAGQDFHQHMDRPHPIAGARPQGQIRDRRGKRYRQAARQELDCDRARRSPDRRRGRGRRVALSDAPATAHAAGIQHRCVGPSRDDDGPTSAAASASGLNPSLSLNPQPQPKPLVTPSNNTASSTAAGCKSNTAGRIRR